MFKRRKASAKRVAVVDEQRTAPLPASLPSPATEVDVGWWRLEVTWTDERGKKFEFFASADEAYARKAQLDIIGLTTHLFFAVPTVTWWLVDEENMIRLAVKADLCCDLLDTEAVDETICLLPAGHQMDPSSRHWGRQVDGSYASW